MSLVYADYLPVFLISAVPGVAVLLALPCLFLVAGAVRRPPPTTPRWLDAAGAGTAGVRAPRWSRPPVGAAMLTGLATALVCLAATFGLATLVWFRTGGASGPNSEGSAAYLILATVALAVAFSAVSASIVAARARQGAATLAILAALVTTGLVAIVAPLLAGVGMCGPAGAVTQAGCRGAISGTAGLAYGVPIVLGVPRTVVIASMAVAATAVLRRLARVLRRRAAGIDPPGATRTSEAQPSPLQQAWLLALTGAVVANLAIGGYVGYGFFFGW